MQPRLRRPLPDDASELLQSLAREADHHPLERKLIVAPAAGAGRELLRTLARKRGGWVGFEVTTVRPLAVVCASEWIATEGVRVLDAFEEEARLDEAVDEALEASVLQAHFRELEEGIGFRRSARDALKALRLTGVDAEAVADARFENPLRQSLLAGALRAYERRLRSDGVIDIAGALKRATGTLERGGHLPAPRILLLPGLSLRGRAGRFVRALQARGAVPLATDPVMGLEPPRGMLWAAGPPRSRLSHLHARDEATGSGPTLRFFHAAGVHEELREVLRRVVEGGHRWDDVEIATPDPATYGTALHTLCSGRNIDTTFAVGLPVARTRPGRALATWIRWVTGDYPSAPLRRLLETGDLVAPGRRPEDSPYLARTLRSLRVGWGRERYRALIASALKRARTEDPRASRHLSAEEAVQRQERRIRNLESLDRLMRVILDTAPEPASTASPAGVAAGLAAFLRLVSAESEVDRSALERLLHTLDRMEATLQRPTRFATAIATVREHLDIRVPAPRAEGRAPWLSDGGAVHLTDLEHAGLSGRSQLFIVGLDTARFPGGDRQDPFLLDRERSALRADLPLTDDRIHETEFRFASLLARARGTVTLSYPAWEASDARVLQPAAVLLSLFRLAEGSETLGYGDLLERLGTPASRVPRGRTPLDGDDVWLDALALGGKFQDGTEQLRGRHLELDRGLMAAEASGRPEASPQVGMLGREGLRLDRLDPRSEEGPVMSASQLEALGTCPLRYFYSKVLRVRPPDDPEFSLERWLGAGERGTLLHGVFQAAVDAARAEGLGFDSPEFHTRALACLDEEVARMKAALPPPGDAIFHGEVVALRADVASFCTHLADGPLTPDQVVATEFSLGEDEPVRLPLPGGGTVRIRGRIDRVDRLPTGLRVVDYKTGTMWDHGSKDGVYRGGRRLQHVVYARALEGSDASPALGDARVSAVGYHFPTVRGQNQTMDYTADQLAGGLDLIAALVKLPASARFPATDDPGDCKFCDYAVVCRHAPSGRTDGYTPRVQWSQDRMEASDPALAELRAVRESES